MADEEQKEEKKGGGNLLMIILLVLVVLLLGAVGFLGYYIMTKDDTANTDKAKQEQKEQKAEDSDGKTFAAEIKDLVVNITDAKGRDKLMKISFTIKSTDPQIQALVDSNNAEIVDSVIELISARTSEELLTIGGKTLLKDDMLTSINQIINEAISSDPDTYPDSHKNNVKKIFFTSFVMH